MDNIEATTQMTTAERVLPTAKDEIIKEAKRIEKRSFGIAKAHFAAAESWRNSHLWIGIAISASSTLAAAFTFSDGGRIAVGVVELLVALVSAVATFLNPNEKAATHHMAGNNYDALCTRSRIFWTIECWKEGSSEQTLTERLRDLTDEMNKLNQSCPQTPRWAVNASERRIKAGEGVYQVSKPE